MWELHDGTAMVGPLEEDHVIRMIRHGIPETTLIRPAGTEQWRSLRAHAPFAMAIELKTASAAPAPQLAAPPPPPMAPPPGYQQYPPPPGYQHYPPPQQTFQQQQQPVTIQQTSKGWKAMSAVGVVLCGFGFCGTCTAATNANMAGSGMTVAVVIFVGGIVVYAAGNIGAWWSNG